MSYVPRPAPQAPMPPSDWRANKPQGTKNEAIKNYGELPFKAYSFGCGFVVATCLWSILMHFFGGT